MSALAGALGRGDVPDGTMPDAVSSNLLQVMATSCHQKDRFLDTYQSTSHNHVATNPSSGGSATWTVGHVGPTYKFNSSLPHTALEFGQGFRAGVEVFKVDGGQRLA